MKLDTSTTGSEALQNSLVFLGNMVWEGVLAGLLGKSHAGSEANVTKKSRSPDHSSVGLGVSKLSSVYTMLFFAGDLCLC